MNETIEQKTLYDISKKSLTTLENLINSKSIDIPIEFKVLLDISVGAIFEAEMIDQINLIDVLVEDQDMLYDIVEFQENDKYNLHDIISQIICFRLISVMEGYLKHINVEYQSYKETLIDQESKDN